MFLPRGRSVDLKAKPWAGRLSPSTMMGSNRTALGILGARLPARSGGLVFINTWGGMQKEQSQSLLPSPAGLKLFPWSQWGSVQTHNPLVPLGWLYTALLLEVLSIAPSSPFFAWPEYTVSIEDARLCCTKLPYSCSHGISGIHCSLRVSTLAFSGSIVTTLATVRMCVKVTLMLQYLSYFFLTYWIWTCLRVLHFYVCCILVGKFSSLLMYFLAHSGSFSCSNCKHFQVAGCQLDFL